MKLRMCNCRQCKAVRREGKGAHQMIDKRKRAARAEVKRLIKQGVYDALPVAVACGYAS